MSIIVDRRGGRDRRHPQVYRLVVAPPMLTPDGPLINSLLEWAYIRNDDTYLDIAADGSSVTIEIVGRGADATQLRGVPTLTAAQRAGGQIVRLCDCVPELTRCQYGPMDIHIGSVMQDYVKNNWITRTYGE